MSDEMGTTTTVPTESKSRLAGTEQVKHTPGPWQIEPDCIISATAEVANIICGPPPRDYESYKYWDANARLIAAAPHMLAELNAVTGYLLNAKIDLETGCTKATAIKTIEGGLARVRAAIAKATGGNHG